MGRDALQTADVRLTRSNDLSLHKKTTSLQFICFCLYFICLFIFYLFVFIFYLFVFIFYLFVFIFYLFVFVLYVSVALICLVLYLKKIFLSKICILYCLVLLNSILC